VLFEFYRKFIIAEAKWLAIELEEKAKYD
jgi:hypothetical protein